MKKTVALSLLLCAGGVTLSHASEKDDNINEITKEIKNVKTEEKKLSEKKIKLNQKKEELITMLDDCNEANLNTIIKFMNNIIFKKPDLDPVKAYNTDYDKGDESYKTVVGEYMTMFDDFYYTTDQVKNWLMTLITDIVAYKKGERLYWSTARDVLRAIKKTVEKDSDIKDIYKKGRKEWSPEEKKMVDKYDLIKDTAENFLTNHNHTSNLSNDLNF